MNTLFGAIADDFTGATDLAGLLARSGVPVALRIGPGIAPGVPWTYCESAGQAIALTLKSGNFGTEAFFSDAQTLLDGQIP